MGQTSRKKNSILKTSPFFIFQDKMISLCTTNYNKSEFLSQFFKSIITYESELISEIVIVDDCSSDDSISLIQERQKAHPRINLILIQNTTNQGPSRGYQKAISQATNDYIMILDSDDFLIARSLQEKLTYFDNNPDCRIVYGDGHKYLHTTDTYIPNSLNNTFFNTIFKQSLPDIKSYFHTHISNLYVPGCLVKTEFLKKIGGFDTSLRSNDWVLNIRIFDAITDKANIGYIDKACFAYRIGNSNLSHRYTEMLDLMLAVADKYSPDPYQKKILLSNIYFTIGLQCVRNNNKSTAWTYFKKSIEFHRSIKKTLSMISVLILPHALINSSFIQKNAQVLYSFFSS